MSCFRNKKAEDNFIELVDIFNGDKDYAKSLIVANNGYSLDQTKTGEDSELFRKIQMITQKRDTALFLKALIYKRAFDAEPSIYEFSGITEKQLKVIGAPITEKGMKSMLYADATALGEQIGGKKWNVKRSGLNTLTTDNPTATANMINNYYGQTVAVVSDDHVVIGATREQLRELAAAEVSRRYKEAEKATAEHAIQQYKESNRDIAPLDEDENYDLDESLLSTTKEHDLLKYKEFLEDNIKKLKQRQKNLVGKKKLFNDRETSKNISDELVRIRKEVERLTINLNSLNTEQDVRGGLKTMASQDAARVRDLIRSNNAEDLLEAQDIIEWYKRIGDFSGMRSNPFFKDVKPYRKDKIRRELSDVSDIFIDLESDLDKRIKEENYKRLISHRNYEKMGINIKMDDLFNSNRDDIDKLSSWLLNPNFTFDFGKEAGDNLIAQLMTDLFMSTLSKKDAFVKNKSAEIDVLLSGVSRKLKTMGYKKNDYSFFYQKDEDGNLTPYLITPYSANWFNFKYSVSRQYEKDRARIAASESTDYSRADRKRFQTINESSDFLDLSKIPEIKQEFKGQPGFSFSSAQEMQQYSQRLKERFGKYEYERIVATQIKLLDEYNQSRVLFEQELLQQVDDGNITTREKIKRMSVWQLKHNPFNVVSTDSTGRITKDGRKISFDTSYIEYIPKQSDTKGFINKDFNEIRDDEHLYQFWNVLSESMEYINQVLIGTGESNITFNSMLEMRKSIFRSMIKKGLPFRERVAMLFNHITDNLLRRTRIQDDEFIKQREESETAVFTGKIQSLRGNIMKTHNRNMYNIKKFLVLDKIVKDVKDVKGNTVIINISPQLDKFIKSRLTPEAYNELTSATRITYKNLEEAMRKSTEQQRIEQQSLDIPKIVKTQLTHAARIDASNETIPVLRIMKKLYQNVKTEHGKERFNANKRIDRWYTRVVRGYFGGSLPGWAISKKRVRTAGERKQVKELREHLVYLNKLPSTAFTKAEITNTVNRISEIGRPLNKMFMISQFQSWVIIMGMAYNLKAGAINYFHGYYQNKFHDAIGSYWTPGNVDKAFSFVIGKGRKTLYKASAITGDAFGWKTHAREIGKAELFINKIGIIQDVRNEKQKASRKMGKEEFSWKQPMRGKLNPYYLSITGVEWRNQSTTIFALLMDENIKNKDGEEFKIFNGKQFIIYDNVNADGIIKGEKDKNGNISKGGNLRLKNEFRYNDDGSENTENIENWEEMTGSDFTSFKINATNAVVSVHGDYSNTGGMAIKDNIIGKAGMTFLTFLPMLLHSRLGAGINLSAGTNRQRSVYRSVNAPTAGIAMGILGGLIMSPLGGLAAATVAYSAKKITSGKPSKRINKQGNLEKQGVTYALELLMTLKAYAISIANVPISLTTKRSIPINFGKRMTKDDAKAMRGILMELGMITNFLLLRALAVKMLKCEEDTEWCEKRTSTMNWLANNLDRILDDLTLPMNPLALFDMVAQGAYLMKIEQLTEWIVALWNYDKYTDIYTTGKDVGKSRRALKTDKFILPSVVKNFGLWSFSNSSRPDYFGAGGIGDDLTRGTRNLVTGEFQQAWEDAGEAMEEFKAPAETDRIFRTQMWIDKVFARTPRERAEEIINSVRTGLRQQMKIDNEYRTKPLSNSQITNKINKIVPTVNSIEARLKKKHPDNWEEFFEYEIQQILDEYD